MFAFYVIASSPQNAYKQLFDDGSYYLDFASAEKTLKNFGRDHEAVYEILMPMPTVLIESKKKQRQKEKQNASQ